MKTNKHPLKLTKTPIFIKFSKIPESLFMYFGQIQLRKWPSIRHLRINKDFFPTSGSILVQLTSFKYYSLFKTRFNTKIIKTPSVEIGRTLLIFVNVVANLNSQNDEVRKVWIQIVILFFNTDI